MTESKMETQPDRNPSCLPTLLISLALLLILPLLGIFAGVRVLDWLNAGGGRSWQALGAPPAATTSIETADLDVIYVRAGDEVFECRHAQEDPAGNACWQEAAPPFEIDADVRQQTIDLVESKPPPGAVVASLTVTMHYPEAVSQARYALLDDGSVWLWRYSSDVYSNLLIFIAAPLCGLALALPIVLLLGLRLLRARRRVGMMA